MTSAQHRTERDSLGPVKVPQDAYYGASTQRAVENFPISQLRFDRRFIQSLGLLKLYAAQVNQRLGLLDKKIGAAIERAASEVAEGKFDSQFVVDIFQTGSGTSTNMNANEIIANRAIEILGGVIGSKSPAHPNNHVNRGQSSNDVIPSALQITLAIHIRDELLPAMNELADGLAAKAERFWGVIKTARTHLQDATPIRLGQEFQGYADQVRDCRRYLSDNLEHLKPLALGGTAVGTGIGAHRDFAKAVIAKIAAHHKFEFVETSAHFKSQSTIDSTVLISGALKTFAVSLIKIANDIRLLGSGPRAGVGEIDLPAVQPGSSIMPGKVNPVIAESVCMVCAQVIGADAAITFAGQSGLLELNVMLPVAYYNANLAVGLLAAATRNFNLRCVKGLEATAAGPAMVESGLSLATALAPIIGYDKAAEIAKEAARSGETVRAIAKKQNLMSESELDKALEPFAMTEPSD